MRSDLAGLGKAADVVQGLGQIIVGVAVMVLRDVDGHHAARAGIVWLDLKPAVIALARTPLHPSLEPVHLQPSFGVPFVAVDIGRHDRQVRAGGLRLRDDRQLFG